VHSRRTRVMVTPQQNYLSTQPIGARSLAVAARATIPDPPATAQVGRQSGESPGRQPAARQSNPAPGVCGTHTGRCHPNTGSSPGRPAWHETPANGSRAARRESMHEQDRSAAHCIGDHFNPPIESCSRGGARRGSKKTWRAAACDSSAEAIGLRS
jgi:hypothetical protein